MKFRSICSSWLFAMFMLSVTAYVSEAASPAGPPPDVTKDSKAAVGNDWNLGPTGMRGWMFVRDNYTAEARQILVTKIDKGSPADGVMELGDVILGVNGKAFTEDARRVFGRAIEDAETDGNQGLLKLIRWRKGEQQEVAVKLKVMGAYNDTAPYDCPKSRKILGEGCRYIAEGLAKGQTENRCHIAHLALLASGNPEYRDELKTYAHQRGDPNAKFSIAHWVPGAPGGWTTGYTCVYLSEYYLATGDAYVLPLIKEYAHFIALGQSRIGTWASNMAWTDLNGGVVHGNLPGYGALNQAGLVCHMGLILAKKCGTEDPEVDQAIDRANKFFGYYIGKGTIPYGDHNPTLNCHDDNGKNCEAALVFDLQDLKEGSQFFSKMATASYEDREEGHTGNTFSYQWAGLGVARGGPKAVAAHLKELRWYYDLARCWNGSFIYQGLGGGAGGYWDSTAGYMLTYALPLRKIYLTGKDANPANWLSDKDVEEAIEAGRPVDYARMDSKDVLRRLDSWSLVVRTWAAEALAASKDDVTPALIQMLDGDDARARIGACQAIKTLKARGAPAVPTLARLLKHDDIWVRICAGEALAGIGEPARAVLPEMLKVCAQEDAKDPRGFQPRGMAFSLFYPGGALGGKGLLADSIEGVDRSLLYPAIRRVVRTDDGRARGCMRSTYQLLTPEDIKALAPDIIFSIEQKAPSGEMFAGGVRLAGVKMLAKHHIKEGIPLCFTAMDWRNWGAGERIAVCLDTLKLYGAHALPVLKEIERAWTVDEATQNAMKPQLDKVREVIQVAENDKAPPRLISIKDLGGKQGTQPTPTIAKGATEVSVIPRPVLTQILTGEPLALDAATVVQAEPGVPADLVKRVIESLRWATGIDLKEGNPVSAGHKIVLRLDPAVGAGRPDWQGKEAYRLTAGDHGVEIVAKDGHGLFNGIQTLTQLAQKAADGHWLIPPVKIEDYPRFAWRGYLLDPARHFRPKAEVLRMIDLLALHKLNVLQLHLTDDQGWRVEIPRYPKLTEIGAKLPNCSGQKGDGWFYTRADVAEIVRYAGERFVTVVPEIEMPGHSGAATASYPEMGCEDRPAAELCVGKEATFKFAANVLDEVMSQFPSPYIHIGADEVQPQHWRACPVCKARMEALAKEPLPDGVTPLRVQVTNNAGRPFHEDIGRLQGEFVRRIDQHIRSKGRRMVGWDEILEGGLAADSQAVVMAWRSADAIGGATGQKHDVVAAIYPEYYLDNQIALAKTYAYEPVAENMPATLRQHVLGVQGNMWGESTPTLERVFQQTFPRLCALAEIGWTLREARDFENFTARLKPHARRLEK